MYSQVDLCLLWCETYFVTRVARYQDNRSITDLSDYVDEFITGYQVVNILLRAP